MPNANHGRRRLRVGDANLNGRELAVDVALWDLKAKRANMPLNQLLGGRCRDGVPIGRCVFFLHINSPFAS